MTIIWDESNAIDHFKEHNIDLSEVRKILQNPTTIKDLDDPNHNNFFPLGFRYTGVLLRISYDILPNGTYKIITVFKADVEDRKLYRIFMRRRSE